MMLKVHSTCNHMGLSYVSLSPRLRMFLFPLFSHPGRERISSKNVAHIMNNEAQRKYLVSVKRLMTYLQDKRTDIAPSKKVR